MKENTRPKLSVNHSLFDITVVPGHSDEILRVHDPLILAVKWAD